MSFQFQFYQFAGLRTSFRLLSRQKWAVSFVMCVCTEECDLTGWSYVNYHIWDFY